MCKCFEAEYHAPRGSDCFWVGLSPDVVIEQVLMRSIKTTGGLTRGHTMSESQQTQWLLARLACADINNTMQQFTDTKFYTSDQHEEDAQTRKSRDEEDISTNIHVFPPGKKSICRGSCPTQHSNWSDGMHKCKCS